MLLSGDYNKPSYFMMMDVQVLGWVLLLYSSGEMVWMSSLMLGGSRPIIGFPRTPCNCTIKFSEGNGSIVSKSQHKANWGIK